MNAVQIRPKKTKAFDKVYAFLDQRLKVGGKTENFLLPPLREIAKEAGVSPSSARNALLDLSVRGHVKILPGSGAFWIPTFHQKKKDLVIGVNTGQNKPPTYSKLYGGMVQGAMRAGIELKFKPFIYEPAFPERLDLSKIKESVAGIDGCLLCSPYIGSVRVAEFLAELNIPFISINPLSLTKTVNFLSPDYYATAKQIGRIWAQTGRKRILLIQAPGMQRSTSCELIYSGLVNGLGLKTEMLPEVYRISVAENARAHGSAAFRDFVARTGKTPDAVHCTADALALGVLDVATELGIDVPTAMSVIGGNGADQPTRESSRLLTATEHPIEQMGVSFIDLFQSRIANQMHDVPGIYFPMRMLIGRTTRPVENELLAAEVDAAGWIG